jgi:ElaB/YqjD/DUF883 family membrane-anchored ribosome-binding protein
MPGSDTMRDIRDLADSAAFERLQKDVGAVKNDLAALADQITETISHLGGAVRRQAKQGYRQAQANIGDVSERGEAWLDAAQDAAASIEETLEDVVTQRPLATVGLALGLGFLIGAAWRR